MSQNALQTRETTRGVTYTPRVDILETDGELLVYADLPGVKPEDMDIRCENGELTLHGKVAPRQPEADYHRYEYGVGDFYRTFTLSEAIDTDQITAEMKDGVLTLHLPKSAAVRPRKITVKAD